MTSKFIIFALPALSISLVPFCLNFGGKFLDTFIKAIYYCAEGTSPAAKNVSQQNYWEDEEKHGNDHWNETRFVKHPG